MKRSLISLLLVVAAAGVLPASAATLNTAANSVIPAETQQIISVDYRKMNDAPSAVALKKRVLPDALKQFEQALRGVNIDTATDVETLTFAAFKMKKEGLRVVGIAQGNFSRAKVLRKLKAKKVKGEKYRNATLYPMVSGLEMTFLDDNTLLFGDQTALQKALDTRDGETPGLSGNTQISNLVANVDQATVWSVLDTAGTQHMLRQALGDASKLADYETMKKRIQGSYYTADFDRGVAFDLTVMTSDSLTAGTLSSVIRAGMLYRKMSASSGAEKLALESTQVESDSDKLKLHFKADDKRFQSLLSSDLFAAVSR
ncbi:MAG: hypothetical protein HYX28_02280 [Candidatus Koribacter versatilis]|uniref:Uncharacterized protein n=1 Tax=Candidatus Korobacter versatilis TaxID=658062 RepID=A0A932EQ19_9BACT|nr:hypothetical protein [Candidatus Koribacter versatilis]